MPKCIIIMLSAICCITTSCKNEMKSTVTGWWTIDTIYYHNYEIRNCLLGNSLWFNEDGSVKLPVPEDRCSELITEYNEKGKWNIKQQGNSQVYLTVDSKNVIFGGNHQIVFRNDDANDLLLMEIKSDSLYVLCRKGLFNYDRNQRLIADLEKISGGKPYVRSQQRWDDVDNNFENVPEDSVLLKTGWYYVESTGLKRQLYKSEETYLISPKPIVTSKNILYFEIYEINASDKSFGLKMQLDEKGTKAWSVATEKATGKRLAFIVDNTLVQVPIVNGQIDNGTTALTGHTKAELDSFKRLIERQR